MVNSKNPIVSVNKVTKSFKIPNERSFDLKQQILSFFKGKKGYRVFTPLKDIEFEVYEGDFFGIVGKNGSGKSTLLKIIANIYTPNKGSVEVDGTLVPFIELGVGFNPELTGRENVYLNGALLGFNHKEIDNMYDDIVQFAEMQEFMEERLKNYSSGMQVRLAFSIAVKAHGDILLLDEVLAVGDAAFQQKCFDYFEQLKREKKTIIIVTHDMTAVKRFCNRAMLIEHGEIKMIGTPNDIADLYTEDNIEANRSVENDEIHEKGLKLTLSKKRFSANDTIEAKVQYESSSIDEYVNLSLVRSGIVIADLNTKLHPDLNPKNTLVKLRFKQSLTKLNPGTYEIRLSLHRLSDDHLLEHLPHAATFLIGGYDVERDGSIKLDNGWEIDG